MDPPSNETCKPKAAAIEERVVLEDLSLDEPTKAVAQKRESRRRRRSLRESGDFLGVQGINPVTGELDVLTPSSSSQSELSLNTQQKIGNLARAMSKAKKAYKVAMAQTEEEMKAVLLKRELEKLDQRGQRKDAIRDIQRKVKWRQDPRQWSSAQEPELSPIPQSRRSLTPRSSKFSNRSIASHILTEIWQIPKSRWI